MRASTKAYVNHRQTVNIKKARLGELLFCQGLFSLSFLAD
ncbi:hypothetical protein JCM19233_3541 [Vibrio astriarenae]|nr:hypothetical protein JCM19233_3541 [Vibrio sp. C7]